MNIYKFLWLFSKKFASEFMQQKKMEIERYHIFLIGNPIKGTVVN